MAVFAGRLSRWAYAAIALPCAVSLYTPMVRYLARILFDLAPYGRPLSIIIITSNLLIIPLFMAVVGRLRHAGFTAWFALPMVVFPMADALDAWDAYIDFDGPSPRILLLHFFGEVSKLYGLGLALIMLIVPPARNLASEVAPLG